VRHALAIAAAVIGLVATRASAVITVASNIEDIENPTQLRTQAVITEPSGFGSQNTAVAIKEIRALIRVRDGQINNGLLFRKRQLTPAEAFGQGLPFGEIKPPTTDPEGPWFGLVWPFRDQYDYFPEKGDPLGDDVGQRFQDGPLYGFSNIVGLVRGGPTDPEPAGPGLQRLQRGITGNGLQGPATYFQFDVIPIVGPFDRRIQIEIVSASAVVVQRSSTGVFSEITVPIADFSISHQLPEPAVATTGALLGLLALRRRQHRS
jgi:hypothetical protein